MSHIQREQNDLQNGLNKIEREALPIEVILKAIYNQPTTKSAVVLVRSMVEKEFSCYFPLQNLIFASNSKRKSDLQNRLNDIENKALPIEVVL